jgi:hypothetical protein
MQKAYSRINWENYPSEQTPINESNLNRMDSALDEVDDRVIALDTTKAEITDISTLVESVTVDDATGEITLTKYNGSTTVIQTTLNKIAVNFSYDYATQDLILTLNDGTEARISLAALIQNNEFDDTPTIDFTVSQTGHVSAIVVEHSIGDEHLRTDYLADIRVSEANAAQSATDAEAHKLNSEAWADGQKGGVNIPNTEPQFNNNSLYYSRIASSWARGQTGLRTGEDTNNASYFANISQSWARGATGLRTGEDTNNSKYFSDLSQSIKDSTMAIRNDAAQLLQTATDRLTGLNILVNFADGCLYYDINSGIRLQVNTTTGNLDYEVVT